jgi:ribosome-associated heat shock protein Hsp15
VRVPPDFVLATQARRDDAGVEETRVDRWLWAVRIYKTRSMATDACRAGHVRIGRVAVKPAHAVRVGDRVLVSQGGWERDLGVLRVIDKRVGPPVATTCIDDHSPPPPRDERVMPLFPRDAAAGRPTKRERRDLDRFRGR